MREITPQEIEIWRGWAALGLKVRKPSGKPFKSGSKVNTITGMSEHFVTKLPTFTFAEDDSQVECFRCMLDLPPGSSAS